MSSFFYLSVKRDKFRTRSGYVGNALTLFWRDYDSNHLPFTPTHPPFTYSGPFPRLTIGWGKPNCGEKKTFVYGGIRTQDHRYQSLIKGLQPLMTLWYSQSLTLLERCSQNCMIKPLKFVCSPLGTTKNCRRCNIIYNYFKLKESLRCLY